MKPLLLLVAVLFRLGDILPSTLPDTIAGEIPDSLALKDDIIVERLLRAAGNEGYFEARMESLQIHGETVYELIYGTRYEIARIAVDGIGREQRNWIMERLRRCENEPWDSKRIGMAISDILERYETIGFPFASVTIRHVFADSATSTIRMRLSVSEGPLTRLQGLIVGDSVRTQERTLSRMTGLLPGMLYDHKKILDARTRLLGSGYFSRVSEPIIRSGLSPDRVTVGFDLEERSLNSVSGALGLSREGRISGMLGLSLRNIAGSAREASLQWEGTDDGYTDFSLYYREPWILGLPPAFEIRIRQTVEDTLWIQRQGEVSVEWDLGSGVFGTLGYSAKRIIPGENVSSISSTRSEEGWGEFAWIRERGEPLITRGYAIHVRAGYERRKELDSGGTHPAVRLGIRGRRGLRISPRLHFDAGLAWNRIISSGTELTQPELHWLGGTSSVRGYRDRQFRSDNIGWLRSEWHYIIDPSSSAFAFMDGGYYSGEGNRWIFGYGIGFRALLPIGVFETAYAIPRNSALLDGRVHMIVSQLY